MRRLAAGLALVGVTACGGAPPPPPTPPQQSPRQAIVGISPHWRTTTREHGFNDAPNPIELFDRQLEVTIELPPEGNTGAWKLQMTERLTLRDGQKLDCTSEAATRASLQFGRKGDSPAVELSVPALSAKRRCVPEHPVADLQLPAAVARYRLKGEELQAFEPADLRAILYPVD